MRLAREKQINAGVVPTIDESVGLSHQIFTKVFRKAPERMDERVR
jgi:hypothetical protein